MAKKVSIGEQRVWLRGTNQYVRRAVYYINGYPYIQYRGNYIPVNNPYMGFNDWRTGTYRCDGWQTNAEIKL